MINFEIACSFILKLCRPLQELFNFLFIKDNAILFLYQMILTHMYSYELIVINYWASAIAGWSLKSMKDRILINLDRGDSWSAALLPKRNLKIRIAEDRGCIPQIYLSWSMMLTPRGNSYKILFFEFYFWLELQQSIVCLKFLLDS